MSLFTLRSEFKPAGDQPNAIAALVKGVAGGARHQTLRGVTGSGKTFTMANVIAQTGKPALVIAHNKTLAAQLAQEYRDFFPEHEVHYFVSYYDYYQPEAYIPHSDTYIEKEAQINEEIDRLRHAATQALLSRTDVVVVASVSAIYGLGSPEEYERVHIKLTRGEPAARGELARRLVATHFERTNADLSPGTFRVVGNAVEVIPPHDRRIARVELAEGKIARIARIDPISRALLGEEDTLFLFPAKHFITPENERDRAIAAIESELEGQLAKLIEAGRMLEAERLKRRTRYDLALIREVGYCNGIENYSRHFDGRAAGEPPNTLLSYFARAGGAKNGTDGFLTIIDESHVTIPQIAGMYAGDRARKDTLVEHGFRLPSARDNRPLTFEEFEERVGATLYTSATPARYELEKSGEAHIVEQIIRPTGLVDPQTDIVPIEESEEHGGQVTHFIDEAEKTIAGGGRVLATTLTKRMAEDLADYLTERGIKAEYLHSDIKTIERVEILTKFRQGNFDCLVGVNLLREGLDLPEVELIGILDADKEGFLRSDTALIQTIGRAARNVRGRVILYADCTTGSLERAVGETERRREIQLAYNKAHGITPQTIVKKIADITAHMRDERHQAAARALDIELAASTPAKLVKEKRRAMAAAVKALDFETAAILRDEIKELESFGGKKAKKKR